MIITIHQPLYWPWLGFFDKLSKADTFVYLDSVQFSNNDYQHRNKIRTKDCWQYITVPIKHNGFQAIKDVEIDNTQNWRAKHLKSIEQNYSKAPYYDKYIEAIRDIYSFRYKWLDYINEITIFWCLRQLGIEIEMRRASNYNFKGQKSDLILDICKQLNADTYISGAFGRDYLNLNDFKDAGIEVIFQSYQHPTYKQAYEGFEPYMSILDLLMNYGDKSLEILKR